MSTLKDVLNQIAKKANEEKEDKEKFLILRLPVKRS